MLKNATYLSAKGPQRILREEARTARSELTAMPQAIQGEQRQSLPLFGQGASRIFGSARVGKLQSARGIAREFSPHLGQ